MGKYFTLIMLCCGVQICFAQTQVVRKNKLTALVSEKYNTVITADKQVKQGQYQAFYRNKVVIAQGMYKDDKRVGLWRFFMNNQQLSQVYDYDKEKLLFELPEDDRSGFKYIIDEVVSDSVVITKPYKIGGRYYGFLPYLRFFMLPEELRQDSPSTILITVELFISPMGRVADFKFRVKAPLYERTISIDPNRLLPEDRAFVAATYNKQPISSRIVINAYINSRGELDID